MKTYLIRSKLKDEEDIITIEKSNNLSYQRLKQLEFLANMILNDVNVFALIK